MSDTAPIEHPSWLTSGDFTEADEPLRLFAAWIEEATTQRAGRSQRHGARDRRCGRHAECADGAAEGRSTSAASSSTPTPTAQRAANSTRTRKAALVFHWKSLRRQVRVRGPVEAGLATPRPMPISPAARSTRPDRRLGEQAIGAARKPAARSKRRWRSTRPSIALGTVPRPPYWSGYRDRAASDRILAGPAVPPA